MASMAVLDFCASSISIPNTDEPIELWRDPSGGHVRLAVGRRFTYISDCAKQLVKNCYNIWFEHEC